MSGHYCVAIVLALAWLIPGLVLAQTERLVPTEHTTIQAAIDEAIDGDTVLVDDGTSTGNIDGAVGVRGDERAARPTTPEASAVSAAALDQLPLAFVENRGQWSTPARFVARRGGVSLRLEKDAMILQLEQHTTAARIAGVMVRMGFEKAADSVVLEGLDRQPGVSNYLRGSDRSKWRTGVPQFGRVVYRGLYEGVDLRVREHDGHLEYDVLLEPGACLDRVVVRCEGLAGLSIDADGALVMTTALGDIRQKAPTTWYELPDGSHRPVECHYRLVGDDRYGFAVEQTDPAHRLVIDPTLLYATYLGGAGDDSVLAVAADADGIITAAGRTRSPAFPISPGAYSSDLLIEDGFVTRFEPGSNVIRWSTYLGGAATDRIHDLVLEPSGIVTVTGLTGSFDFPTTPGAYDSTQNGANDAFVARLDPDAIGPDQLVWSTFVGGSGDDWGIALDLDPDGKVLFGGNTASTNFPRVGVFSMFSGGTFDAFVSRLDPSQLGAEQLDWSMFLGGSGYEGWGFEPLLPGLMLRMDLDVGNDGLVTVAGRTWSSDFPTSVGAYDEIWNGGADVFVTRLDPETVLPADPFVWSTYLGGSEGDVPYALQVEPGGEVVVGGHAYSSNFPTTPGAYLTSHTTPGYPDMFVTRLNSSGSALSYSTFMGGDDGWDEIIYDLEVDDAGRITAVGVSWSPDFPTTPDAYQAELVGLNAGCIFRLDPASGGATDLLYSTRLGGNGQTWIYALALSGAADLVYFGGTTSSSIFPVTPDAMDGTFGGGSGWGTDGFVGRLAIPDSTVPPLPGPAVTSWSETFDTYAPDSALAGQGEWTTWDDGDYDALVGDTVASSAPNSVNISGTADMVRVFRGVDTGQWTLEAKVYVPSTQEGSLWINLLNTYQSLGMKGWSSQVMFNAGTGTVVAAGGNGFALDGSLPLIADAWTSIRFDVDLDANHQTIYYGTQMLAQGPWQVGGLAEIQAFELYGNRGTDVFIDDVVFASTSSCTGCCPITTFTCETTDCATGDVALSWTAAADFADGIELYRDGVLIATLPGDATEYQDEAVAPGSYHYDIEGRCSPTDGWSGFCDLDHVWPGGAITDVIFRGELEYGLTDSVGAIFDALVGIGRTPAIFDDLEHPCFPAPGDFEVLWVALGTFPSNRPLTSEEGLVLANLSQDGIAIFCEGADIWGFDVPTAFAEYDGVDNFSALDGDDSLTLLQGYDSGFGLDLTGWDQPYVQDFSGNDWTDRIQPADPVLGFAEDAGGPRAGVIWRAFLLFYNVGIHYDSDFAPVICQSWEFGGYGEVDDRIALAESYVGALTIHLADRFVRGDVNQDGLLDVSDPVALLSYLFVPGTPPLGCDDALDIDDNGVIGIGDPIHMLSALFISGSPGIPDPFPTCGPDPTPDSLECAFHADCP